MPKFFEHTFKNGEKCLAYKYKGGIVRKNFPIPKGISSLKDSEIFSLYYGVGTKPKPKIIKGEIINSFIDDLDFKKDTVIVIHNSTIKCSSFKGHLTIKNCDLFNIQTYGDVVNLELEFCNIENSTFSLKQFTKFIDSTIKRATISLVENGEADLHFDGLFFKNVHLTQEPIVTIKGLKFRSGNFDALYYPKKDGVGYIAGCRSGVNHSTYLISESKRSGNFSYNKYPKHLIDIVKQIEKYVITVNNIKTVKPNSSSKLKKAA